MKERYHIISTLATGGSGSILHAWDNAQSRDVAIKRLNGGAVMKDFLLREARSLYALRHPNIVTIHEYDSDEEGAYMVMEMIKGESLEKQVTSHGPLSIPDFRLLVMKTLDAITAAHEVGIIHRDLKPENIMLPWNQHSQFEVKLIDFGLSQQLPPQGGQQDSMIGSIHFMAPEQFGSGHVDVRTDLYALGCIYYFALTGKYPFPGEQRHQVITAHLYPPKEPLGELRPDLSDGLCAWVEQLMSIQPAYRAANATDALAAFRRLGTQLQIQTASGVEEPAYMILEEEELPAALVVEEAEEEAHVLEAAPDEEEPEHAALIEADAQTEAEGDMASEAAPEPEIEPEPESPPTPAYVSEEEDYVPAAPVHAPALSAAPVAPLAPPQAYHETHSSEDLPSSRRMPATPGKGKPKRRANLQLIITAFVVILIAQFALVSYFKYAGRESREQRLVELSESEQAVGSDVDVRMLLDFLADPTHQEPAARALSKLQGGSYINEILNAHLEKVKSYPVSARLVQVIGQRRSAGAFDTLLELASDKRGDVRQAAWTALGRITPADKMPQVLNLLGSSNKRDHEYIEKALITAIESSMDRPAATQHTLQAFRRATDRAETRTLLFNVLTRVGGDETLAIVSEAISDPSAKIRLAAIMILAEYPTHEPLAAITARFPDETDEECRVYLLLAARELISKPGPSSQQQLFVHGQSLYANAKGDVEKRYILSVLSRTIAPGTATFFEEFAKSSDAALKGEARSLAKAFRDKLEQVISIPPGGSATLPADKADYRLGGTLIQEEGALINWTQEGDWASWLVEVPANGEYEIALYQSHTNDQLGTYEILLAGQTLLTSVVKTDSANDFKGFVVGSIKVQEAGIYRLRVRAKTLPAEGELFRVQRLVVKAL
ncbi:protein kinase [Prosthecobacter sp. SYSU 5D2]|uniref:protein kinase domain-containing protein n=1 Tax=Prosthecobacter sp. SYSU 5D2 TaxID=3134134 RepID=UPI0031FF0BDC